MGAATAMKLGDIAKNVVNIADRDVKPVPTKRAYTTSNNIDRPDGRNYVVMPIRAIKDKRINTSAAYLVLSAICTFTNRHGETWVGQQTIADMLGVSKQAIQRQVSRLIETGFLELLEKGHTGKSNRYRVVFDPALSMADVKANTPASLQPDPVVEYKALPKEEALSRIANLKNAIKGRSKQTTPEVVTMTTSEVVTSDNITRGNGQPGSTKPTTSGGSRTEVERSITNRAMEKWLNEG